MSQIAFDRRSITPSARRVAMLAVALSATTACFSHRPTAPSQAPSGTVRVTFASPRMLYVSESFDEAVSFAAATEVEGRVESVRGDTLYLRVHRVRTTQQAGIPSHGLATIVRDRNTVVEQRGYNNDRTLGLFLGGLALGFLAFLATRREDVVYAF
jgi:hypothetical protein